MPWPRQTGRCRHNVLNLAVYSCISSSSVRLLQNLWTPCFDKEWTDVDVSWYKWSTGKGMKWSTVGDRRSKVKVSQRSRSAETEDGFGGVAEMSFSTPFGGVGFQVEYVTQYQIMCRICYTDSMFHGNVYLVGSYCMSVYVWHILNTRTIRADGQRPASRWTSKR